MKVFLLILINLFCTSNIFAQVSLDTKNEDSSNDQAAEQPALKSQDEVKLTQSAATQSQLNLSTTNRSLTKKRFNSLVRLTAETDFKESSEYDKAYGSGIDLFLNYIISDEYKANLWLKGTKDFSDGYDESIGDSTIRISKSAYEINNRLTFSPSFGAIYPTSKLSKVRDEMIVATDLSGTLTYKASNKLSLTYITRPQKYFHKFETNREGRTNNSFRYLHFFSVGYAFSDKFSLNPLLILTNTWSYSGRRKDDTYLALIEANYQQNEKLAYSAGVVTGGSIESREKGKDETVEFYDANSSSFYGQIDIRF